jgi:hypothetical protein
MRCSGYDSASNHHHEIVSVQANMSATNVKASASALAGMSAAQADAPPGH